MGEPYAGSVPRPVRLPGGPLPPDRRRGAGVSLRRFASPGALLRALAASPFLVLASSAGPLLAQEVKGVAVEAGSERPIEGAFVSLMDESGRQMASALTSSSGAFLLHVFRRDRYRLRVERIGYETWESETFEAGAPRQVTRRLEVPIQPVQLSEVRVTAAGCRPRPGAGQVVWVWEEARKALEVVRWGEREGGLRFQVRLWEREMDLAEAGVDLRLMTQRVRKEEAREAEWTGGVGFLALPAEDLAAAGFVRREEGGAYQFYMPDARTFLSDPFQESHCFWLVRGEGERAGQVGVAFRPVRRGRVPDVEGVLWVAERTGELRELEFRYTDLDLVGLPRGEQGAGWAEFRNLASGEWLVSRWWIRWPLLRRHWQRRRVDVEVFALREDGGEVTEVRLPDGEVLALAARGSVAGDVTDGIAGGPLAGAEVYLAGTERRTRTDETGRFRLELVAPGRYGVRARHPHPLLEGLESPEVEVEVRGERVSEVGLSFPVEWAAAELCGAEAAAGGALLGRVLDAETGVPVPEGVVWVRGGAVEAVAPRAAAPAPGLPDGAAGEDGSLRAAQADSTGAFLVCGLPAGEPLAVQASGPGRLGEPVELEVAAGGLALRELQVSEAALAAEAARLEERARQGEETVVLRGVVRSAETGDAVRGAQVRLLGTERLEVTGEEGTFLMAGLQPGRYRVVTERLGMASDTVQVELYGSEASALAVFTLETRPVELPGLTVEIERTFRNPRLAGFYQRMERRLGHYIAKEDLRSRDVVANFRRLPGVTVEECVRAEAEGLRGALAGGGGDDDAGFRMFMRVPNCWTVSLARGRAGLDRCQPVVYLDGHLLSVSPLSQQLDPLGTDPFSVLQRYPRYLLEGVEVYRNPAMAPAQYRTMGDACGIILVWTRGR